MPNRKPSVLIKDGTAVFDDGDGNVVRATSAELRRLYHVLSGSDVYANDEEFWLVEFDKTLIVIPDDDTDATRGLLLAWNKDIEAEQKAFEAVCALPPASWRIKRLGFLPSTKMKFAILSPDRLGDLEGWKVVEPLAPHIYC